MATTKYTSTNNSNGHSSDLSASSSSVSSNNYYASIDLTLKISDLYQLAIKNYLNKSFNKSWDLVIDILDRPIIDVDEELAVKVYKLYLSLYDLMLKDEFYTEEKLTLTEKFQFGALYNDLVDRGIKDTELYLIVFIIERSNELDLKLLASQLQQYLQSTSETDNSKEQLKIFKLYLFNVLPELDRYAEAEMLIMKRFYMEEDIAHEYINRLNLIRQDIQKKKKVKKSKEEAEIQKQSTRANLKSQSSTSSLMPVTPAPVSNNITHGDERITITPTQPTNKNVIKRFTKIISKFYRQNNSLLMFLLLVISLILSLKRNKGLLLNTLKMIFKVSYV